MRELFTQTAGLLDAVRPVHDGPVAGATPVRRHLLGPLERRVHRMRPTDRVVVVRRRGPELVHLRQHELRRLQRRHAVEVGHLVEGAVQRSLGGGAVVADDVVHERVVEHAEVLDGVDHPADVVVGVFQEPGVHLHLARQHRLQLLGHVLPGRNLGVTGGELGIGGHDAELLLAGERLLAQDVPAGVEPARVLVGPLERNVVRRVRRPGGEVREERTIGHQRLLLADPADGVIGEVLGEVVSLLGGGRRFDRRRSRVERRFVLVVLAADEAVERLEAASGGRPRVERTHRRRLPDRHLVTLAELRGRVAVELQRHGQRGLGVGPQRAVAGCRGRGLGDTAHADRVVVTAGQHRLAGRCAQRRRVEPVVPQATRREPLRGGRVAGPSERRRSAEADIVEQHDEDIRGAGGRQERFDRRVCRVGVLRVVCRQARRRAIGDRQHRAGMAVGTVGHGDSSGRSAGVPPNLAESPLVGPRPERAK